MKRFRVALLVVGLLALIYGVRRYAPPSYLGTVAHAQVVGRPVNGPTTRANLVSPWQHGFAWLVTDCESETACDTGGGDFPKILIYNSNTPGWEIASGASGAAGGLPQYFTFSAQDPWIVTEDGTGTDNSVEGTGHGCDPDDEPLFTVYGAAPNAAHTYAAP
jgi:hypothetical protein